MITAQEIREKVFEKAVFGGYDMTQVDEFMAEVSNDLALLSKENSTLKAKMKVLADKVAEYRGNEEALRMAVVSAQKMGAMIESDAKTKSDAILSDAQTQADELIANAEARAKQLMAEAEQQADALTGDAKRTIEGENARMEEAKRESAKFIENMNLLCRRQLSFLEKVSEMDFVQALRAEREAEREAEAAAEDEAAEPEADAEEPETPEIHETVRSIEETVARAAEEPVASVLPDISPAPAEDELPTRPFTFVTDPGPVEEDKPFQLKLDEISD